MLLTGEQWSNYTKNFVSSAFRLEVQPTYTMPSEAETFGAFLGGRLTPPPGFNQGWLDQVSRNTHELGKTMQRVRVVQQPLTDYQRYGFAWAVPLNVAAGEDIRILDRTGLDLDLPPYDFWMFDNATVVHLNYRPDGTQINRELQENPDLSQYFRWQELALAHSVPFKEFDQSRGR
jgi:hypothetical protein